MNISQFKSFEKKTPTGYKDKQKKEAFSKRNHVVDRELVQQFKCVVAVCVCEAFCQLSSGGRKTLKQRVVGKDKEE